MTATAFKKSSQESDLNITSVFITGAKINQRPHGFSQVGIYDGKSATNYFVANKAESLDLLCVVKGNTCSFGLDDLIW